MGPVGASHVGVLLYVSVRYREPAEPAGKARSY